MAETLSQNGSHGAANAAASPTNRERSLGIYAINLDRSPERWAAIEGHFGKLRWPLHRVRGIDARIDRDGVLAVRGQTLNFPPDGIGWSAFRNRVFTLVEEACLSGHVLAWQQFLASDHHLALILEDDAEPYAGFEDTLAEIASRSSAVDVIKLEGTPRRGGRLVVPAEALGQTQLVRSFRPRSGAAGYVLTRSAAIRLVEAVARIHMPVDDFLWSPSLHGCKIAHVSPWVIRQSGTESTMQGDRSANKRKRRNAAPLWNAWLAVRRFGLRLAVWSHALEGRPWRLLGARVAAWSPTDLSYNEGAALAAKD
ncbi:hypothetical protein ASE04_00755 [Rhizobium sp. Root708]|uniref:glycosyltransferase family 25 protein n=1 Tax=Rhizobium sp. Root708 TaxID=1736592 RepID=UPI0006F57F75|nr:glycosyltransferase family 25 protein [Rhizobium sp. Root708]KRB62739.1 hypothetical protein ASE04_00755 [Rhizobium sp. Root708]